MFDLKTPCNNCPFRKGMGKLFMLRDGRITEIIEADAFQCHKTLGKKPQQCAGLMGMLLNSGMENAIMQVGSRLGWLDLTKLDTSSCYESIEKAREEHRGR